MEFAYAGGGLAKGGTVTLYLDGGQEGEGRVEATVPLIFSADETARRRTGHCCLRGSSFRGVWPRAAENENGLSKPNSRLSSVPGSRQPLQAF